MALVDDWFAEHSVHATIEQVKTSIADGLERETSVEVVEKLNRFLRVAERAKSVLATVDPELVPMSTLDQLNNQLQASRNHLRTFADRGDKGQIEAAAGPRDNILQSISQLSAAYVPPTADAIAEATSTFRYSAGQHVANLKKAAESLRSDLQGIKKEVNTAKQTIETEKGRLDTALTDFQTEFREAEQGRARRFEESAQARQDKAQEAWSDLADQFGDAATEKFDEFDKNAQANTEKASAIVSRLAALEEEAKRSVSSTGEIVLTAGHADAAAKEKRDADRLRAIALIFFLGAAVMAVLTLTRAGNVGWEQILARAVGVAALAVPALYAARESAYHRQRERVNRKMALELAAMDPYLAHFEPDERNQIKTDLTDRFFGVPDPLTRKDDAITAGGMYKLLERVLDRITK